MEKMENLMGLLRIRVRRGINLAVRDTVSSDPYVVVTMGCQKLKTRVIKNDCNPQWDDELTLMMTDLDLPMTLTVYDKDTFTEDDKMGVAWIDIKPYLECLQMGLENLPIGTSIKKIQPDKSNCLDDESRVVWVGDGKLVQDMILRLQNAESGKVEIQIEWIAIPGSKAFGS
ncbi:hypothetical protein Nepgr_003821 [Nepenthes gracilis]|uniref:C2 domain-containing protein n=1 Tax=Nepenthes gracilis TaxID=150966 RepID=A0AAD3S0B0_NEPGR|nr:hypothetical protein Nepgr_003821 [Nepenthes gracilis]